MMQWSVVVCDLLFKLQHLVELYGDEKARTILAENGKLQKANGRIIPSQSLHFLHQEDTEEWGRLTA